MGKGPVPLESRNPYSGEVIWVGHEATEDEAEEAVASAHQAFGIWRNTGYATRKAIVMRFTNLVKEHAKELTQLVAMEAGKPHWEARIEVNALVTKLEASADAFEQ